MTSTKTVYQNDSRLYFLIFGALSVIVGIISHPVKTNGELKTLAWTLRQIAHCIPLHILVTYCISRAMISFQLLQRSLKKSARIHAIVGILGSAHSLHSWYKIVKGEPIKGLHEVILIGCWNVLPSAYLTIGGAMLLPHIPRSTDLIYIKTFVSMLFFCLLQMTAGLMRLLWVIAGEHKQHSAFLRSLGKAIGLMGMTSYGIGLTLNAVPVFDFLYLRYKGIYGKKHASPASESDKTRRSIKWFFWDLWFLQSDSVDSEMISKSAMVTNVLMVLVLSIVAYAILFLSNLPDGSLYHTAVQENNATFLSMAAFIEVLATSTTVTNMFDGSLVLIGRKTSAEIQYEFLVTSICLLITPFATLSNGVIENYPQFHNMMMMGHS